MKIKTRFLVIDTTPAASWKDRASNVAEWEKWDRAWRDRLGWRAGLSVFRKTSGDRHWNLLSRHWPHRLCWSWIISASLPRSGEGARTGLFISRPFRRGSVNLLGASISFVWQDSDHMANLGRYQDGAPEIYWKHHLENATPAGVA